MAYRKKMSFRQNKKSFKKGLKSKRKNYHSGFAKRGGIRL